MPGWVSTYLAVNGLKPKIVYFIRKKVEGLYRRNGERKIDNHEDLVNKT